MGNVVGLSEGVSTQHFTVSGLVLKVGDDYWTSGGRVEQWSKGDYTRYMERGDIISVERIVSDAYANPAALWIGDQFRADAIEKNAPVLPLPADPVVHRLANAPHFNGQFSFVEYADGCRVLEQWVQAAASLALQRSDRGLIPLLNASLPDSLYARSAAYFLTCEEDRPRELHTHLRVLKSGGQSISDKELLARYEAAREVLVQPR